MGKMKKIPIFLYQKELESYVRIEIVCRVENTIREFERISPTFKN